MLNRIYNVSKTEHPLSAFDKLEQFKLFVFDTGLLKHMAGIDNSAILLKADYRIQRSADRELCPAAASRTI